ncbi:MAG: efflux RND transporter periplasmic adaptor subunit [Candidatus Omnitrophota bacterium]
MDRKKMSFIFAGVCVISVYFTGCAKKTEFEETARPIKYMVIEKSDAVQKKVYNGVSRSTVESQLSFRVGGKIEDLPIKVGQTVVPDQVLATLDPVDYKTRLNEMEARYVSAKADIERYRLLYEEESATKQELDQAQAAYDVARSQYELAKKELSYTVLKAPLEGRIVRKDAEVNENVAAGQAVCVIETGRALEVKVGLPEHLIGRVKKGDSCSVSFKSVENKTYNAVVTEVGVRVDEKTATFPVTVEIEGQNSELRAGMVADVEFTFMPLEKNATVIKVPPQAVLEDPEGRRYVWVYDKAGSTVNKRQVESGEITQSGVEIISGLEGGETIATAGAPYLHQGQKVTLWKQK